MAIKVETIKSEREKDREELWRFYEKAIEGRNFLYKHYIQYVNLYAIFTGAFFIAFYNFYDDKDSVKQLFAAFIALLGFGTSCLWLCCVKGYYAWIINWITIVQYYEDLLNVGRLIKDSRFVYRLFYDVEQSLKLRSCIFLRPSRYSTQKLTMLFIEMIIVGWYIVICMVIYPFQDFVLYVISCLFVVSVFLLVIMLGQSQLSFSHEPLKDDIKQHFKLAHFITDENPKVSPEFTLKNKGEN